MADAKAMSESVKAQYEALQTAQLIVFTPEAATLADNLLRSAGYVDHDAAPIVPQAPPGVVPTMPLPTGDTSPLTPPSPPSPESAAIGVTAGMTDGPHQPPQ
jgi:hypothetical protein